MRADVATARRAAVATALTPGGGNFARAAPGARLRLVRRLRRLHHRPARRGVVQHRSRRGGELDHLHGLLDELTATTFFRLINVNMDGRCPYWGASPEEDDEPACESKAEDTAVPLCTLGTDGGGDNPFGAPPSPFSPFASSIPEPTTDWVDHTTTPEEESAAVGYPSAEDCSNEELPTFWLDMCAAIPTNASDYVNLQLNPERYTGYNGSHVWAAIYEELPAAQRARSTARATRSRCSSASSRGCTPRRTRTSPGTTTRLEAEEPHRVGARPRLLRPPVRRPPRAAEEHALRLRRAAARRPPRVALFGVVPVRRGRRGRGGRGGADGGARRSAARHPRSLVVRRRLRGLRRDDALPGEAGRWWSLRKQFKGVFHNVSTVLDCVSCQKCRLHAR